MEFARKAAMLLVSYAVAADIDNIDDVNVDELISIDFSEINKDIFFNFIPIFINDESTIVA